MTYLLINIPLPVFISFRISPATFVLLRDQALQLFPTEDPDLFYVSAEENKNSEATSAKGSFYNYYRVVRKELRNAGLLDKNRNKSFGIESKG